MVAAPWACRAAIRMSNWRSRLARNTCCCLLERARESGAHVLSGAVLEPHALAELFPDWQERGAPPIRRRARIDCSICSDATFKLPTPPQIGAITATASSSVRNFCRWLGEQAEALGVEISPGFRGRSALPRGSWVKGVATGGMGIGKDGEQTHNYQPGVRCAPADHLRRRLPAAR